MDGQVEAIKKRLKEGGLDKQCKVLAYSAKYASERGSAAYADDALIARAVKAIKAEFGKDIIVFTDICLCEYTNHGHCGLLHHHDVDNDSTLPLPQPRPLPHPRRSVSPIAISPPA